MAKYKLSRKAVADLTSIWEYSLEKWSENQADRYYQSLIQACEEVAGNPDIGKSITK